MKHYLRNHSSKNCLSRALLALGLSALLLSPGQTLASGNDVLHQPAAVKQAKTVKGHVVDETGEPMIGVTVKVSSSGFAGGTITDLDGNFTVELPSGSNTLILSYTGYKTKTVQASGSLMNITMEPDTQGLEEVVVIGFGTVKKRDVTGSVASVKSDVILQTPTSSVT